jgi:hypothetical protein
MIVAMANHLSPLVDAANDIVAANELYNAFAELAMQQNIKLDLDSYSDHVATEDVLTPKTAPAGGSSGAVSAASGSGPYMKASARQCIDSYKSGQSLEEISNNRGVKLVTVQ